MDSEAVGMRTDASVGNVRGPVLICMDLSKGLEGRLDEMKRGAWRIVDSYSGSSFAVLAFDGSESSVALTPTSDEDEVLDVIDGLGSDSLVGCSRSGPLAAALEILPGGGTMFLLTDGLGLPRESSRGDSAACRVAGIRVVSFGFGDYDWNLLRKISADVCPGRVLERRGGPAGLSPVGLATASGRSRTRC